MNGVSKEGVIDMEEKQNVNKKEQEMKEKIKEELKDEIRKEVLEELKEETKKEEKNPEKNFEEKAKETIDKIMDTEDTTKDYKEKDIKENKGLAMISYFGPLALVPFLVSKESKFVQYHAKQGLNLFIVELIIAIFSYFLTSIIQIPKICTFWGETTYQCGMITPWWVTVPISLLETITFIIAIVGIVYSYQGKAKELPIIGKIKIIK